jgi:hypothetical protein
MVWACHFMCCAPGTPRRIDCSDYATDGLKKRPPGGDDGTGGLVFEAKDIHLGADGDQLEQPRATQDQPKHEAELAFIR